jgi:hypothetical protein
VYAAQLKARFCAVAQRLVQIREGYQHGLLGTTGTDAMIGISLEPQSPACRHLAQCARGNTERGSSGEVAQRLSDLVSTDYPSERSIPIVLYDTYSGVVSFQKYQNGGNDSIWPFRGPKRRQCMAGRVAAISALCN